MASDTRDLPLTTASDQAATHFNAALEAYFEYRLSSGKLAKRAVEADPDFALGHCLRGYLFMLFGSTAFHARARAALEQAEARVGRVTWREAAHVAALRTWLSGDMAKTCALWEQILVEAPRDLLALRLQHFALFWMGCSTELRGAPARALHAWDESVPGCGNLLGMLAFGLEECGDYAQAEAYGKRAVELNPDDLWAVHAVAHVLEMQGRLKEGTAWLDYPAEAWQDRNPFRGHLWWHRALFFVERGELDAALALYDRSIRPERSDFYLDLQNAASLLARLEFLGADVGERWVELADHVEGRLDDHVLAFTDPHAMMALAAEGRVEAAGRLLDSLRAFARRTGDTAAATMDPLTIPLCQAILAFRQGHYERAAELIVPLRPELFRLGGSHAQRDVFDQFLLEAATRGGNLKLARALLSERALLRPHSAGTWSKYAAVLDALGEPTGAARARERAAAARAA